jgi:hypothetical protein
MRRQLPVGPLGQPSGKSGVVTPFIEARIG